MLRNVGALNFRRLRLARQGVDSGVIGWIREQAGQVVQPGVVKLDRHRPLSTSHGVREMNAAVTGEARQRAAVKQDLAAFRGVRNRGVIALEVVAIVGRPGGHDRSLERGDRLDDVLARDGIRLALERRGKQPLVCGLTFKGLHPSIRSIQSELDWIVAAHRHQRLILEPGQRGIRPGQHLRIRDVHQAHAAARMALARRSHAPCTAIRERTGLLMAGAARLRSVARDPGVIEEVSAEFHLDR